MKLPALAICLALALSRNAAACETDSDCIAIEGACRGTWEVVERDQASQRQAENQKLRRTKQCPAASDTKPLVSCKISHCPASARACVANRCVAKEANDEASRHH